MLGPLPSGGNALFNAESLQLTDRIAYAYILSLSPALRGNTEDECDPPSKLYATLPYTRKFSALARWFASNVVAT